METLESEERGNLGRGVRGIVVGEFREGEVGCPVVLLVVDVDTHIRLENLVNSFRLSVGFGVIGGREIRFDLEERA